MVKLSREMVKVMVEEFGPDEFLKRITDPVWFQSLGTVLAFDWNASGLTTILTAALKEAIRDRQKDLGIFICGGKGKTSRKTPEEILSWANNLGMEFKTANQLVYNSKMAAKVDGSLVQDGYQIYHHSFFFSSNGRWAVVQQGMNINNQTARRYHWYSDSLNFHSPLNNSDCLVLEPHSGIFAAKKSSVLNLTSRKSEKNQETSVQLVRAGFKGLIKDVKILAEHSTEVSKILRLKKEKQQLTLLSLANKDFDFHPVVLENSLRNKYLAKILYKLTEEKPKSYEGLLATSGVGPRTIRALSLVAEVIYGAKPSYEDPARYSFAHGGKDDIPYPVDVRTYDQTIKIIKNLVNKTKLPISEKEKILKNN